VVSRIFEVSPATNGNAVMGSASRAWGTAWDFAVGSVRAFGLMPVGNCRMIRCPQRFEAVSFCRASHVSDDIRIAEGTQSYWTDANFPMLTLVGD
jgi:hypothetical protein